jgi:hypothetical protein
MDSSLAVTRVSPFAGLNRFIFIGPCGSVTLSTVMMPLVFGLI